MNYPTTRQKRGLCLVGDFIIPGNETLPSFSSLDPSRHLPRVIEFAPESDRKSFLALVGILGYLPRFLVNAFLLLVVRCNILPGFLGAQVRLIEIGLKGVIYTLYYCDESIHKHIGWDAKIRTVLEEKKNDTPTNGKSKSGSQTLSV